VAVLGSTPQPVEQTTLSESEMLVVNFGKDCDDQSRIQRLAFHECARELSSTLIRGSYKLSQSVIRVCARHMKTIVESISLGRRREVPELLIGSHTYAGSRDNCLVGWSALATAIVSIKAVKEARRTLGGTQ
jgi:hypothetical protein